MSAVFLKKLIPRAVTRRWYRFTSSSKAAEFPPAADRTRIASAFSSDERRMNFCAFSAIVPDRIKPLRLYINFAVGGAELEEYQEAYSDDEGQQAT